MKKQTKPRMDKRRKMILDQMTENGEICRAQEPVAQKLYDELTRAIWNTTDKYFPLLNENKYQATTDGLAQVLSMDNTALYIAIRASEKNRDITKVRQEKNKRKKEQLKKKYYTHSLYFHDIMRNKDLVEDFGKEAYKYARAVQKKVVRLIEKHYPLFTRMREYDRRKVYHIAWDCILGDTVETCCYNYRLMQEKLNKKKKK